MARGEDTGVSGEIVLTMDTNKIYNENCMDTMRRMPDGLIDCVVTSPPYYGLRDYGHEGQIGLEETPEQYVQKLVEVFRLVREKMKDNGTLWLNLGDSYASMNRSGRKESPGVGAKQEMSPIQNKVIWGKGGGTNFSWRIPTDSFGFIKPKDLIGIPWMVAFALRADGWYLRQDIIWHKPNPMPESVTDRCTKSHEYIFLLTKSQRYFYDYKAIQEKAAYDGRKDTVMKGSQKYNTAVVPGQAAHTFAVGGHERWQMNGDGEHVRNKRSVWTVTTKPYKEAHFATYPEALIVPCIKAGCPEGGIVYDPFMGSGTTALVSHKLNRNWIGSELNPEYVKIAEKRLRPHLMQVKLF